MFDLEKLIRKNILSMQPYSSARDEFEGSEGVFLDANENPFSNTISQLNFVDEKINRYPDPYQKVLKERISETKKVQPENIFIGNGSDEIIDLLIRLFCSPAQDKLIICPPTYGMYEVAANINDIEIIKLGLTDNFQLDINKISELKSEAKIIFLCSPNNPTGNILKEAEEVLKIFKGVVIIDEAYIDFADSESYIKKLDKYPNLVVIQTFSKAWGLAAARVGIAYADKRIIGFMNKIKPPYNVSKLNQFAIISAIHKPHIFHKQKEIILAQRKLLEKELSNISCVVKIYPSDANFLFVEVKDANKVYNKLLNKEVITRNRNQLVKNCIRITVGTIEENQILIDELNKIRI